MITPNRSAALTVLATLALGLPVAATAQEGHPMHEAHGTHAHAHAPDWIPPSAGGAIAALDASPRHGEWVMVRMANGDSIRSWVVYPERSDAAPVLVVIHEIYGLTNWIRSVADQAAAEGFIAIAPDLITMNDVPRNEAGDPEQQPAVAAIRSLDVDRVHAQIRAVAEFAMGLPAARGVYGITGFCWGGSASFEHATRYPDLAGAAPFYGSSPSEEALARVRVPVMGHYGGDDARVNATIPRAEEILGGGFQANLYDGAGHGFLRQQDGRDGANHRASVQAWPKTMGFFTALTSPAGSR